MFCIHAHFRHCTAQDNAPEMCAVVTGRVELACLQWEHAMGFGIEGSDEEFC
jgi:hypothetical protein